MCYICIHSKQLELLKHIRELCYDTEDESDNHDKPKKIVALDKMKQKNETLDIC